MYAANGKVYAGGNGGVHSTDDHGITPWKYAGNGLPKGEIVRLLHAQGEYLFAAVGSKGLYRAKLPAVGVEEPPTPSMLTISPNPTADGFTVRYTDKGGRTLAVRDMFGRIRFQAEIKFSQGNSEISVPTDDFAQGVYYVEIINADGSRASAKVIFNR
jgi:hypothetical protein